MVDSLRTPRSLRISLFIMSLDANQSTQKACIVGQGSSFSMIDVPVIHGVGKHDTRSVPANRPDYYPLAFRIILKESIRKFEVFANADAENLSRCRRFSRPDFGRTPCSQLASREVNNTHLVACRYVPGDCPP